MRRSLARAAKAVLWLCGAIALGVAPRAAGALPLVQAFDSDTEILLSGGQLEGTLDSGDDLLVSFTQGLPGQIELVSSSEVSLPWAVRWVAAATLLVLGAYALRPLPARR
jgi:hypothetical protein